jgi:2,4-didehydro-3-deoxy-L-rhamnonate hydrolase
MEFVRYGESGLERPGLLDAEGLIRDLSGVVPDLAGPALRPDSLQRLRDLDARALPEFIERTPANGRSCLDLVNGECAGGGAAAVTQAKRRNNPKTKHEEVNRTYVP